MNQKEIQSRNNCALILGGGLNGYSTVRELHKNGVKNLIILNEEKNFAFHSNKLTATRIISPEKEALHQAIKSLHKEYELIVAYPVSDIYIETLCDLYSDINDFCYIGFNPDNIHNLFKKSEQYAFCKEHNIIHPKTENLAEYMDSKEQTLTYPLLVKPDVWNQDTLHHKIFKTLVLNTEEEFTARAEMMSALIHQGINLLITEIVPGGDDAIYGYVAYRSKKGEILNEWIWKKLSQHPEGYGVFSTISNQGSNKVRELGREIFQKMNLQGINEIEFKYDSRDDQYKYIENNFRTPMFLRLGYLTGVDVCYTQYLDAMGIIPDKQIQIQDRDIHYVLFRSELQNLIARPGYITKFWHNIFHSNKTYFSMIDINDLMPMIYNLTELFRAMIQKVRSNKSC